MCLRLSSSLNKSMKILFMLILTALGVSAQIKNTSSAYAAAYLKASVSVGGGGIPAVAGSWTNFSTTGNNYVSNNITISGANKMLVVFTAEATGSKTNWSTLVNGVSMTEIARTNAYSATSLMQAFTLADPADGTVPVVSFFTNGIAVDKSQLIILLTSCSATVGTPAMKYYTTPGVLGITNTVTSFVDGIVIDGHYSTYSTNIAPLATQTFINAVKAPVNYSNLRSSYTNSTATSTVSGWYSTNATAYRHSLISIPFQAP